MPKYNEKEARFSAGERSIYILLCVLLLKLMAWKFWEAVPPSQVLGVYDTWVTQYHAGFMDSVEEGSGKTLSGVLVVHPHLRSSLPSECLAFPNHYVVPPALP